MKTVIHKANSRGHADHGWLNTHHTFSFASYYDPKRIRFGLLRVLNDDIVAAGKGFGTHPHDNMEIITIPIKGVLEHKDSMGNRSVIHQGEVQIMSAGTGITHSEFNHSQDKQVEFLQIWIFPNEREVTPRYAQMKLDVDAMENDLLEIISPDRQSKNTIWLHQDSWFSMGELDKGVEIEYRLNDSKNGVYLFVIEGDVDIDGELLSKRDGMGVWEMEKLKIESKTSSKVLIMEVPMEP